MVIEYITGLIMPLLGVALFAFIFAGLSDIMAGDIQSVSRPLVTVAITVWVVMYTFIFVAGKGLL